MDSHWGGIIIYCDGQPNSGSLGSKYSIHRDLEMAIVFMGRSGNNDDIHRTIVRINWMDLLAYIDPVSHNRTS
tara:strand:- start:401 stop:619 length:219 start_codon:yes stop_codon:yes gene_type:complete